MIFADFASFVVVQDRANRTRTLNQHPEEAVRLVVVPALLWSSRGGVCCPFDLPGGFLYLGSGKWIGIPVSIWIAAILYVVFGLFLRYHRLGRALYAIGGNVEAARVAGVRVDRVLWGTFIVAGMLAALAGLMLTGRIASVVPSQGQNMIFYVFAAAVIGGISLNGGKGRLLGALTGVLLLGILQNVLTLAEIPAFWIDAVYGAIILIALVVSRVTGGTAEET
jgi:simple sugar transport system permease protein